MRNSNISAVISAVCISVAASACGAGHGAAPAPGQSNARPVLSGTLPQILQGQDPSRWGGIDNGTVGRTEGALVAGPDGNMYFPEAELALLRVGMDGSTQEINLCGYCPGVHASDIALGSDGKFYLTVAGSIMRATTSGYDTSFSPPSGIAPLAIAAGPDGNLWFTESNQGGTTVNVGKLTTAGVITEYPMPDTTTGGDDTTAGPDGKSMWFTTNEAGGPQQQPLIGRIDITTGAITLYNPQPNCRGGAIVSGPDHNIWVVCGGGYGIVEKLSSAGTLLASFNASGGGNIHGITVGPDKALWFSSEQGYITPGVYRLTTSGSLSFRQAPTSGPFVTPVGIAVGPDGNLWMNSQGSEPPGHSYGAEIYLRRLLDVDP